MKTFLLTLVVITGQCFSSLKAEPVVSIVFESSQCYVGTPNVIIYQISWIGDPDDFVVLPIEIPEISWGEIAYGSVKSYQDDDAWIIQQQLALTPHVEGEFILPEVRVGYVSANELPDGLINLDEALDINTHYLVVDAVNVVSMQPVSAWVVALPIVGVLVIGVVFAFLVWWRRSTSIDLPPVSRQQKAMQDLHQAQRLRLDGDYYAMYLLLSRIVNDFGNQSEDTLLINRLKETTQAVGFQGKRPSEDELSGDIRDVERLVTQLKEEPS